MNKKKSLLYPCIVFAFLFACIIFSTFAYAKSAPCNKFEKKNSGNVYYYDKAGKRVTGLVTIKGKKYYFDSKGVQQNGWQKIKGNYYFFRIKNGAQAYMVTSGKVNQISLAKNGKARYNSQELRKLNVMVYANQQMRQITKRNMSMPEKLWICFQKAVSYNYGGAGNDFAYRSAAANWDVGYAEDMFYRGRGNCFAFASAFAYLANAVGYEASVVSSGGHGWAEIKGKVCDPDWAKVTKNIKLYYRMDYNLSGINGIPRYKNNRAYVKIV